MEAPVGSFWECPRALFGGAHQHFLEIPVGTFLGCSFGLLGGPLLDFFGVRIGTFLRRTSGFFWGELMRNHVVTATHPGTFWGCTFGLFWGAHLDFLVVHFWTFLESTFGLFGGPLLDFLELHFGTFGWCIFGLLRGACWHFWGPARGRFQEVPSNGRFGNRADSSLVNLLGPDSSHAPRPPPVLWLWVVPPTTFNLKKAIEARSKRKKAGARSVEVENVCSARPSWERSAYVENLRGLLPGRRAGVVYSFFAKRRGCNCPAGRRTYRKRKPRRTAILKYFLGASLFNR